MTSSIKELSKRTVTKVLIRLKLSCFECGWNLTVCDIHHIIPISKHGTDEHSNLTYLCPNCHRLAHAGILTKFKTLEEVVGELWKDFYFPERAGLTRKSRKGTKCTNLDFQKQKSEKYIKSQQDKIEKILNSDIDFSKFGWVKEASIILEKPSQKVANWMRRFMPEFYKEKCFKRKLT